MCLLVNILFFKLTIQSVCISPHGFCQSVIGRNDIINIHSFQDVAQNRITINFVDPGPDHIRIYGAADTGKALAVAVQPQSDDQLIRGPVVIFIGFARSKP